MNKRAAGKKNTAKKPIESYDHKDKKRANNPPVGLVTPDTDPGKKKTHEYGPHLDPRSIIEATRQRNGDGGNGVLSGSKTRKPAYLETI